jgi:hypothetical protein
VAVVFPSTPVLDNFNRTAENPLTDGGLWTPTNSSYGRTLAKTNGTQALTTQANGTFCGATWRQIRQRINNAPIEQFLDVAALPDVSNWIDLQFPDNATSATANGYYMYMNQTTWGVRIVTGGTPGATITSGSVTWVAGDGMGCSITKAGLITCYRRSGGVWSVLGSGTDTTYTAALYTAWDTSSTSSLVDNYGGGVAPPQPPIVTDAEGPPSQAVAVGALR